MFPLVTLQRLCTKTACGRPASCTLSYNYAESKVVLGPLSQVAEPHAYDLCGDHANRLTAPRGWQVERLVDEFPEPPPAPDELVAIADAVRRPDAARTAPAAAQPATQQPARPAAERTSGDEAPARPSVSTVDLGRKHHLRVVGEQERDTQDADA